MKKFFFFCLASIVTLTSLQAPTALGCAINPGDRWFSAKPEITSNPLSSALGISFSQDGSLTTFTNQDLKSDLYIASKDTNGKYPGYDESRKDYRPVEKIIGHDFDPNILISVGKNGLPKGVYTFNGGWGRTDIGEKNNEISGTAVLDAVLDSTDNYKTKQVIGDNRPEDSVAPGPDHQIMYAFYQGKRYDIELVLNYALNEKYNPHKTANSCAGESEALRKGAGNAKERNGDWVIPSLTLALVSIIFIAFVLAPWLSSHLTKRKNSKRSSSQRKSRR
jgi:hypothetical protein